MNYSIARWGRGVKESGSGKQSVLNTYWWVLYKKSTCLGSLGKGDLNSRQAPNTLAGEIIKRGLGLVKSFEFSFFQHLLRFHS